MALTDAALIVGANAIKAAITHWQVHSAAPGAAGTSNVVGSRVATPAASVDADGDISWANITFAGLPANGPVTYATGWSAATNGTLYATYQLTGDLTANSAGDYVISSIGETSTAT